MEQEIWKDVVGYEGLYQISNLGNLRSLDRTVFDKNGMRKVLKGRNKKPFSDGYGYIKYALCKNGAEAVLFQHQLIAKAFISNPKNKPHINHIDGVKYNNSISNLEWCTPGENEQHAYDTGLKKSRMGTEHYKSIFVEADILKIRHLVGERRMKQKDVAEMYNVCKQSINDIVRRKVWKHI